MFGRSKSARATESGPTGWTTSQIDAFAEFLAGKFPVIQTSITSIRHSIGVDGPRYRSTVALARSEQDSYRSMPMLFEKIAPDENSCRLVTNEYELAGTISWPPAMVTGTMTLCETPSKISNSGLIGHLDIAMDNAKIIDRRPALIFHIEFCDLNDIISVQNSLQIALAGNGNVTANFVVRSIIKKEEWIAILKDNGYSPSIDIEKVYITTSVGQKIDD